MARYRMYVDEVGDFSLKSINHPVNKYLSLTAVVAEVSYVSHTVQPMLDDLKYAYFPSHSATTPVILHRKEMITADGYFECLKDPLVLNAFNQDLLYVLSTLCYKVINVLIDKKEYNEKYKVWKGNTYHYCMEILIERYHKRLKRIGSTGDIMVEARGNKEDKFLKNSYARAFKHGTRFVKNHELQKTMNSDTLKVSPKRNNEGCLQLADLIAFPARRLMLDYYGIEKKIVPSFNDKIIDILLMDGKLHNDDGLIEGVGIKKLP
jgi:hypothetical protein